MNQLNYNLFTSVAVLNHQNEAIIRDKLYCIASDIRDFFVCVFFLFFLCVVWCFVLKFQKKVLPRECVICEWAAFAKSIVDNYRLMSEISFRKLIKFNKTWLFQMSS